MENNEFGLLVRIVMESAKKLQDAAEFRHLEDSALRDQESWDELADELERSAAIARKFARLLE